MDRSLLPDFSPYLLLIKKNDGSTIEQVKETANITRYVVIGLLVLMDVSHSLRRK